MSRIVKTTVKVNNYMKLTNYYADKTSSSVMLSVDDDVNNLKYIDTTNKELKTISGRISDIKIDFLKVSKDFNLLNDATVSNITVDASKSKKSNVVDINAKELLEYQAVAGKEVIKVSTDPVITVSFKSDLSDGTSSSAVFKQGMKLFNTTINKGNEVITGDFTVKSFMYRIDYNYSKARIYGMVLSGNTEERVLFEDIKKCGIEGIEVDSSTTISAVIDTATTDIVGIILKSATYDEALTINKNVTLVGKKEFVDASSGSRTSDVIAADESIIKKSVVCAKDVDVVFKGVTFTEGVDIDANGASTLTFKNCKFVQTKPLNPKSFLIKDTTFRSETDAPVLIQMEGCYFGTNSNNGTNKMYNLIELEAKVANGSYFKNCYFAAGCATHNLINLYDVEENSTVEITGNHFEKSINAVRLGFIGNSKCTVIIKDNVYDITDTDPAWAGILLIQPFGTRTTSFENLHVIMKNNKYTGGTCQDGYLYCGGSDTKITAATAPKVECDGYFNFGF